MMVINKIDPVYFLLNKVVFKRFLNVYLEKSEIDFFKESIKKHRAVLWLNVIIAFLIVFFTRRYFVLFLWMLIS